jgi:uncharacterized protein
MPLKFLPAAQHRAVPWKNGLGVSHSIAEHPPQAGFDAVLWQVGVTEIGVDCPFSDLPGFDRLFMVIEGAGVELSCTDEGTGATSRERIGLWQPPYAFRGDWRSTCRLLAGPVRVFNVMTRRGRFSATLDVVAADRLSCLESIAGETLLAVDLGSTDAWLLQAGSASFAAATSGSPIALVRIYAAA